jgi:hypothetical protein
MKIKKFLGKKEYDNKIIYPSLRLKLFIDSNIWANFLPVSTIKIKRYLLKKQEIS